jgi:hypothetical protein
MPTPPSSSRRAAAAGACLAAAALAGCATAPRAVAPRPLGIACAALAPPAFAARAAALMRETGWTVREADSTRGVVRATRGPILSGLGENLISDGPYLVSTQHDGREARVTAQVFETHDHHVIPVENLSDRSSEADLRNVRPLLDGLRAACGAPTSGRTPAGPRAPTLPPPGDGRPR